VFSFDGVDVLVLVTPDVVLAFFFFDEKLKIIK